MSAVSGIELPTAHPPQRISSFLFSPISGDLAGVENPVEAFLRLVAFCNEEVKKACQREQKRQKRGS
jgi:hypothetical protein